MRKNIGDVDGEWDTIQATKFLDSCHSFFYYSCIRVQNKPNDYILLGGGSVNEFKIEEDGSIINYKRKYYDDTLEFGS